MSGTPRDWNRVKAIFVEALDLGPGEREAFLARACETDTALRIEVESLLAAHDDERPFLDAPAVAGAAHALSAAFDESDMRAGCLQPGTQVAQYHVLEPLGSGGMGDVYRTHDTRLDRSVALKIVVDADTARTADRVLHEARAASALNHPNICTVYEVGEFGGRPYLAMEFIDGQTLKAAIPPEGLQPADVVRYGVQVADALAHAHERGVVHRDLKAANVVVTPQGRAKVLDFGIARRVTASGAGAATDTSTRAGAISGTLAYIAPERLRGQPADARSDIWSLGVLLYEMASGRRPFTGETSFEVSSAILKDTPQPLPARVPGQLRAVILKCLEREPADRFQQASDVVAALEAHEPTGRAGLPSFRAAPRLVLGLAAVVLIIAALAAYQWRRQGAASPSRTSIPTLGVLPFKVLSGRQDIAFLGIGVPDNIISRMSLVSGIRVKAALVPGREEDDPQVRGRELGVDYVLTGTILKDGEQIRITPRLIRVADGVVTWTRVYTLLSSGLLRLQDDVARGVVDALPVQMTKEDRARVEAQYTQSAEAYAAYLRGRAELASNKEQNVRAAVAHFEEALARDPDFVLAHAGLAMASARMRLFFAPEEEVREWERRAHDAANRALQIDPELAQSHEALAAFYRSTEFDWRATITEANLALDRNSSLDQSHGFLASSFSHLGLFDRATSEAALVMDLNQANVAEPLRVQGVSAIYDGRYGEAVALLQQASRASNEPAEWNLAYANYYADHKAEAIDMLRRVRGNSARTQRRAQATLASFLAAGGDAPGARRLIDGVIAGSYMDHHVAYSLGVAFAQLDMPKDALKWLGDAKKGGFPCYPWFERDPLLTRLKVEPAFRVFLDDLRRDWETTRDLYASGR
jgi:serine/threonine-protein kinase